MNVLRAIWRRAPREWFSKARDIPSDAAHLLNQCRDPRCLYSGWHRERNEAAQAAYNDGRWCGECLFGVVEDPPCCTRPPEPAPSWVGTVLESCIHHVAIGRIASHSSVTDEMVAEWRRRNPGRAR